MRTPLRSGLGIVSSVALLTLLWLLPAPAWGQGEDARALFERGIKLYEAGRFTEAEQSFSRAKTLAEKTLGPEHLNTAAIMGSLAFTYQAQGRLPEAQATHKRALAIKEKALGPGHPSVANSLDGLAQVHYAQGRYAEAETLFQRALRIYEKAFGPEHPGTANALHNLAGAYLAQARYAEAAPLYRRALEIYEKVLGPQHPTTAHSLYNLALVYSAQDHYAEAEPLCRRALAIREKALGPDHPDTAASLVSLANVYGVQGRYGEAEPLHRRALAIREKALGPDHPGTAASLVSLANVYGVQGRYSEAETLYRRALAIREKAVGPEHPDSAESRNHLALVHGAQGRYAEAEALFRRSLAIQEKAFGPDHPEAAASLASLANIYGAQGRYTEAEPLYRRALAIREKTLGPEHRGTAVSLSNLGDLKLKQQDWSGAYELLSRAVAIHIRRAWRSGDVDPGGYEKQRSEISKYRWTFGGLLQAAATLALAAPADRRLTLTDHSFTTVQWAQHSDTGTALVAMAARFAKGSGALAALVRQRQDLVADYRKLDKSLVAASSKPPAQRKPADEAALRSKIDAAGKQIDTIDLQLKQRFPEYAAVANPEPLAIAETQKHLREDEALFQVFVDDHRDRIFAWVVTKNGARFQALALNPREMAEHVQALRCGLDASRWQDERGLKRTKTGRERCEDLVGRDATERLPFDLKRAHALYQGLFGPFADLIEGKRLLIVADGALTALPFQVLLTAPPDASAATPAERYRKAAWLVAQHPIAVLPSVSSLKALRQTAGRSPAPKAYAAFANPLLTGYTGTDRSAWGKVACPPAGLTKIAAASAAPPRGTLRTSFRGGLADAEALTKQPPLPETADEVCAVAASLGAGTDAVLLGANTTETAVKALSRKGDLKRFRIVHFATHGLIATETRQLAARGLEEPGLILTPPKTATEHDDGLLTASEVAQLDLNADFVILSACNTAAGDGAPNAQALSGLTRAFLYAGARALLVSHWAVDTWAAVDLVTGTFATLRQEPALGRAEALRRAMLAQIAQGGKRAHPSYWAPFVIIGEGS